MEKRNRTTIIWSLLIAFSLVLSGCMKTGSDEIVSTKGNEEKNTGAEETGGNKKQNQAYEVVLTEEEANKDHLTAKLSDLVEIDAYITPYDNYKNGVGQYHQNQRKEEDMFRLFSEIRPEEKILDSVTFSEFIDIIDQMAQEMGPVYKENWEKTKSVDNIDLFDYTTAATVSTRTKNCTVDGNSLNQIISHHMLLDETENLSFMKRKTAIKAVQGAVKKLLPNVSGNFSIAAQDRQLLEQYVSYYPNRVDCLNLPECYRLEFNQTVEGIPINYTVAPCRIKAGDMSPDSMRYHEMYETEDYAIGTSNEWRAASVEISENGFNLYVNPQASFIQYREAQPVIGINEVLKKTGKRLNEKNTFIKVKGIELTMADKVVGEEGEKKRIVLSPCWSITYYMEKTEDGKTMMWIHMLTIDAYSGEIIADSKV